MPKIKIKKKTMLIWIIFVLLLNMLCSVYPDVCPKIVTKTEWGARGARKVLYTVPPIANVIIHHTFTSECQNIFECSELLTAIQNFHMDDLNYDDIAYNFLIGGDGEIYEGRGWHKTGAHTKGYNSRSIAIAFLGSFSKKLPTNEQLEVAKNLILCGIELQELGKNYRLYGARQISATQSPGLMLYNEIRKWPHFTSRF